MQQATSNIDQKSSKKHGVLYQHKARPEWGLAVLAWERGDKRGYQFEDGKLRVFKKGYFKLLEAVDQEPEESTSVAQALQRRIGWRQQAPATATRTRVNSVPFEQQIAYFEELYPKGFQGSKWAKEKRGIDSKRRLKRHREEAVIEARNILGQERLRERLDAGESAGVIQSLIALCDETDLITKRQSQPLSKVGEENAQEVAEGLYELLYGEERLAIRFERFVDTLARVTRKKPSWQLATVFLALTQPKDHVCVKPRNFKTQAASMSQGLKVTAVPSAPVYERLRDMAAEVRDQLVEADYRPRDLLDVYDFMDTTLSPKSGKAAA